MLDDCLCTTHKTDYILEANPIDPKNKETVTVKVHKKDRQESEFQYANMRLTTKVYNCEKKAFENIFR
jgi:hypothetical protein